jgi:putative pyruvate formate lyase activating enzyme
MLPMDKIDRIDRALKKLSRQESDCALCPRECHVDRTIGKGGVCQSGSSAAVSHALLHFGEEPIISGQEDWARVKFPGRRPAGGSGTIFFTGCNLKCLFCQNYQLSWLLEGREVADVELAGMMMDLQDRGALNINLVSPTHVILPVLRSLKIALLRGLRLPIVYNSNGYEKEGVIRLLEGIVDIYLPDLKYFHPEVSKTFSGAPDYFRWASLAVEEMYLQQPALTLSNDGIAERGLIVRHLILPGQVCDSLAILVWIQKKLNPAVCLSLMSQYHPCFKAPEEIRRDLAPEEYKAVLRGAEKLGFENLFIQPEPFGSDDHLIPDFRRRDPFKF